MAADSESPKTEPEEAPAGAPAKRPKKMLTFGLIGGVMLVEGLAIFAFMKMYGTEPDPTLGLELAPTTNPWAEYAEIEVATLRVANTSAGRTILYNVKIVVTVHHDKEQQLKDIFEKRKWTIDDAISRLIQEASELEMSEPGKESLKRKVRHELSQIIHDDAMVEEVLIPELIALPTGF